MTTELKTYAEIEQALNAMRDKLKGALPTLDEVCGEPELVDDVREWARLADAHLDHIPSPAGKLAIGSARGRGGGKRKSRATEARFCSRSLKELAAVEDLFAQLLPVPQHQLMREVAYHEAGHAVIGHRLGLKVEYVEIIDEQTGQTAFRFPADRNDQAFLRAKLFMLEAGICAQKIHCGSREGCHNDLKEIRKLMRRLRLDGDYDSPTMEMVRADRAAIPAVAQALLRKGKLSGAQVAGLIRRAVCR